MNTEHLTDDLAVSGQLGSTDIPVVHAMGFRSVLCCRPDDEALDQTLFEVIESTAKGVGMVARYMPIASQPPTSQDVENMRHALDDLPKPVLAYCETGDRVRECYELMQEGA